MQMMTVALSALVFTAITSHGAAQQWPGDPEMPHIEQCAEPYSCIEYRPLNRAESGRMQADANTQTASAIERELPLVSTARLA